MLIILPAVIKSEGIVYDETEPYEMDEYDYDQIWAKAPERISGLRDKATLVSSYAISPEGYGSLDCAGIYQFDINTYYAYSGWADTTGWGCQDGVEWFGPFESVMGASDALSLEERRFLGFDHSPVPKDIFRD